MVQKMGLRLVTSLALAGAVADALVVTPNSPCVSQCGNLGSSTATDDIECNQANYGDYTGAGFSGCLTCELSSGFGNGQYTDSEAALYNLRYAASYCLWGYPHNPSITNSPCITSKSCGNFAEAIQFGNLSVKDDGYQYCDLWPVTDSVDFLACQQCLTISNENYLANFMTVMQAGCVQKPGNGTTLAFKGQVFSTQVVNVTTPSATPKIDPAWFDHGPVSLGGKVGIAVGGFAFILAVAGFLIVCNGKRRRRAYLHKLETTRKAWPETPSQPQTDMFETPVSQRPLRGWEDSPVSPPEQTNYPTYFSPYSSQFNSPTSPADAVNMPWPEAALPKATQDYGVPVNNHNPQNHGPLMSPYSPEREGRSWDKGEESYEMRDVDGANSKGKNLTLHQQQPPTLNHPGYGRSANTSPRKFDVQEIHGEQAF